MSDIRRRLLGKLGVDLRQQRPGARDGHVRLAGPHEVDGGIGRGLVDHFHRSGAPDGFEQHPVDLPQDGLLDRVRGDGDDEVIAALTPRRR